MNTDTPTEARAALEAARVAFLEAAAANDVALASFYAARDAYWAAVDKRSP